MKSFMKILIVSIFLIFSFSKLHAEDISKLVEIEKVFIKAENALCPGTQIKSCRNPTCEIEVPAITEDCVPKDLPHFGGTFLGGGICSSAIPQNVIGNYAPKYGIDPNELVIAIKDFATLNCTYLKDYDAPKPEPDLCGTTNLGKCPYLGTDKCLVTFSLFSECKSEQYCGANKDACHIVYNGVDEKYVGELGKLKTFEKLAISIFRLIKIHADKGSIAIADLNSFYEEAVKNFKNAKEDELFKIQEILISKLAS